MEIKIVFRVVLSLIASVSLCFCGQLKSGPEVPTVIFDTDLGNDIDDVLALQMLFNYSHEGLIDLKGITISKCNPHSVEVIDGLCRFNGFQDLPLGYAYEGVTPEDNAYLLPTLAASYNGNPLINPQRTLESGIPEGYVALRKWLGEAADNSVILIAVGPLTNIGRLLQSPGDTISSLSGIELMKRKVKRFEIMGGEYSEKLGDFAEYNVVCDLEASKIVFEKCPVGIVASGWEVGAAVHYPHLSILRDFGDPYSNPLCVAYMHYKEMPYDRECWDLTAVFDAIEGESGVLEHSSNGTISMKDSGVTRFTEHEDGKDSFLILDSTSVDQVVSLMVQRVVGKMN